MQRHGNCCKATFRKETAKLLEHFLHSDFKKCVANMNECVAKPPLPPQRLKTSFGPKKVPTRTSAGEFLTSAVTLTETADDSDNAEETRTQLEEELVQELRRIADEIDQNGKLTSKIRQATEETAGLLAYNSFKSALNQYVDNLVGWRQAAFVFQFTNWAVQAAGTAGLNAKRITENCLTYVEEKCADWILKRGGWQNMLSGDSDDTTSERD
ncbi:uncharacterized protein LOC127850836 isoform X2 [Dreissena polymorpha]|uniref:uncharacterized protein LOC127850836 isoform X2 n=1 Tax=Dreissena polymorpha TaxID=45954 RepID=UPI002264B1F9|nr:uncharacterized protein LOC127850836 isoform X2 [Dreissena polymorpha]